MGKDGGVRRRVGVASDQAGSRGGEKVSGEVEEDGLTFCFRAPAVYDDNEDSITYEGDSDRVGGKTWAKGCGTWTANRKRV